MTTVEINAEIAKACNWKKHPSANGSNWIAPNGVIHPAPPNFSGDLNAIHEAVMDLKSRDGKAYMRYQQELIKQDGFLYTDATARQRCLAFLKVTVGQKGSE